MKPVLFSLLALLSYTSFAQKNIIINGGNLDNSTHIAIVNPSNTPTSAQINAIIANDLNYTNNYKFLIYTNKNQVESNTQYVLIESSDDSNPENIKFDFSFSLNNIESSATSINQIKFSQANVREVAHTISNALYKQITGNEGDFTSKIAFVVYANKKYKLIISDYDGYNQKSILNSDRAILSLAWNKDNSQISYVSYEKNKPNVYTQDIYTSKRTMIANYPGSNSSPNFYLNNSLLVTLTKDQGSHIYAIKNIAATNQAKNPPPLINYGRIDTEADSDSKGDIIFTSDHDGMGPQIFMYHIESKLITRVTHNLGNYNTTARFSHDGKKIVFINLNDKILKTYMLDLTSKVSYPVSINSTDSSPSFSPHDSLIIFASGDSIYLANVDGTKQTKINEITLPLSISKTQRSASIIDVRWSN